MADSTPKDYWTALTPQRAVVLLGEDHQGAWTATPAARAAVDGVAEWHEKRSNQQITLWHEGEEQSQSFTAFTQDFRRNHSASVRIRSWEPRVTHTREEELAMSLMGGDAEAFTRQLEMGKPFLSELISSNAWHDSATGFTATEILSLVDKGKHAGTYKRLLDSRLSSAVLRQWFTLRDEAFEDRGSGLYPVMMRPQWARQDGLARLLAVQNGIFLCGDSHIEIMRSRRKLK